MGRHSIIHANGYLSSIRNTAGVRWTVTYSSGVVSQIVGPFGRRTTFTYNLEHHLSRIQDPCGRITSLTVNAEQQPGPDRLAGTMHNELRL